MEYSIHVGPNLIVGEGSGPPIFAERSRVEPCVLLGWLTVPFQFGVSFSGLTDIGRRFVFVVKGSTRRSNSELLSLIWFPSTLTARSSPSCLSGVGTRRSGFLPLGLLMWWLVKEPYQKTSSNVKVRPFWRAFQS